MDKLHYSTKDLKWLLEMLLLIGINSFIKQLDIIVIDRHYNIGTKTMTKIPISESLLPLFQLIWPKFSLQT
jgi:hypothetical protein